MISILSLDYLLITFFNNLFVTRSVIVFSLSDFKWPIIWHRTGVTLFSFKWCVDQDVLDWPELTERWDERDKWKGPRCTIHIIYIHLRPLTSTMAIWDILDVVAAVGTSGVGSLMFLSFGFPNSIVTVRRSTRGTWSKTWSENLSCRNESFASTSCIYLFTNINISLLLL